MDRIVKNRTKSWNFANDNTLRWEEEEKNTENGSNRNSSVEERSNKSRDRTDRGFQREPETNNLAGCARSSLEGPKWLRISGIRVVHDTGWPKCRANCIETAIGIRIAWLFDHPVCETHLPLQRPCSTCSRSMRMEIAIEPTPWKWVCLHTGNGGFEDDGCAPTTCSRSLSTIVRTFMRIIDCWNRRMEFFEGRGRFRSIVDRFNNS